MVAAHKGVSVIELYLVSFDEPAVNDDDDGEYGENSRIDRDDPYWEEVFEPDLFDEDNNLPGPSMAGGNVEEGGVEGNEEGHGEGNEGEDGDEEGDGEGNEGEDGDEEEESDEAADDDNQNANAGGAKNASGRGQCYGDEVDDDEANSTMARSDILVSPPISDEENEVSSIARCVTRRTEFQQTDRSNPQLSNEQLFPSIKVFREAIRENNLKKGKDIRFKKNYLAKCIVVCRDPGCRYRVYGRKCKDQESFEIRSIQDKHTYTRQHKNSIVKSGWIADKLIDKFRVQPNMPLKAILGEVKDKLGVDVNNCQLYRTRRIAKEMLQGKVKMQYNKLWDYCETIKQMNRGSCVMMKVDRPLPDHPACFQRLYFSLAAMKKGFRAGCMPFIGLDGCFLKGTYKGHLLLAISRDGNNNMYPMALAVVEAETKDSWIWFLETLVSNLGTPPVQGWTFISDRQKGLQPAFDVVLPGGDHRFCVRHLYANYRDSSHRGLALKDKLWAAAVAYTEAEFHKEMNELKHISEHAYNYLSNVDPSL
ncbi:uncharacterized protein LOC132168430 [Corylus avellana]|uniref:uncharacterized protein LOC132168430 n=1 Tax=Corylus avellana TaxID=13451 RepID=UPI00286A6601|nr:uncharacterized protein LOC132168430 [Corylus avellana]